MVRATKPVPDGYHTITTMLVLNDTAKALEFYQRAFGAEQTWPPMKTPDGKVGHAEIKIGDTSLMVADEMETFGMPGVYKSPKSAGLSTASLYLYVKDCDAWFERAVKAGCSVRSPVEDMFWGDRLGQVIDPFGVTWSIATHVEDLEAEEIERRGRDFFAKQKKGQGKAG
jgi:PhnB protein